MKTKVANATRNKPTAMKGKVSVRSKRRDIKVDIATRPIPVAPELKALTSSTFLKVFMTIEFCFSDGSKVGGTLSAEITSIRH
jgi:hypothetical protein